MNVVPFFILSIIGMAYIGHEPYHDKILGTVLYWWSLAMIIWGTNKHRRKS